MSTMTRTDIHRPSAPEFDPEGYEFFGCFDLFPDVHDIMAGGLQVSRQQVVSGLVEQGWRFTSVHGSNQCGHCGARIRYAALMGHRETKGLIYVGETCLDNRFSLTKGEFDTLRKNAALNRERNAKRERIAALIEQHPALVWASYAHNIASTGGVDEWTTSYSYGEVTFDTQAEAEAWIEERTARGHHNDYVIRGYKTGTTWGEKTRTGWETSTLADIWHKVERYGDVSEKQVAFVESLVARLTTAEERLVEREAKAAAAQAAGVEVPTGRIVVEGEVVSTRWDTNNYGTVQKMLVQNAAGWKVWGSVPSSIEVDKGSRVRFTATVERSNDDALFGFFKRPNKAEVL